MGEWFIKSMDNWICWICGFNRNVEWWAHPNNPKQYAVCDKCKQAFIKVVANRKGN